MVRAAIACLGERQRAALELHQFHDWTYAEVAARLDMTPKAAKSLLYRTRRPTASYTSSRFSPNNAYNVQKFVRLATLRRSVAGNDASAKRR